MCRGALGILFSQKMYFPKSALFSSAFKPYHLTTHPSRRRGRCERWVPQTPGGHQPRRGGGGIKLRGTEMSQNGNFRKTGKKSKKCLQLIRNGKKMRRPPRFRKKIQIFDFSKSSLFEKLNWGYPAGRSATPGTGPNFHFLAFFAKKKSFLQFFSKKSPPHRFFEKCRDFHFFHKVHFFENVNFPPLPWRPSRFWGLGYLPFATASVWGAL